MRCRVFTLLVLIYVALDFVNPMMPGAVQFVGTSLETVAGCQPRSTDALTPEVALLSSDRSPVAPARDVSRRACWRIPPSSPRRAAIPFRVPFEQSSAAPSSSDDD
jgi:hypothetical protein